MSATTAMRPANARVATEPAMSTALLRRVGYGLMIGGFVAQPALRWAAHWRARMAEERAALWLRIDQPGVLAELVGSALVLTAQRQERRGAELAAGRARYRRGGSTPPEGRATPAG